MNAIIICGPTASGKTELAHHLALKIKGEIINADSMQIYKQIPIITSSPSKKLKQELPYHLYNFHDFDKNFSVIQYLEKFKKTIYSIFDSGKIPIIVGGTGMYISMLLYGYNDIPKIQKNIRDKARNLYKKSGPEEFYKLLYNLDKNIEGKINPTDSQRLIRAYEVFIQTKQSIFSFHNTSKINIAPDFKFHNFLLLPERSFLYEMCNSRLIKIFNSDAIDEISSVYKKYGNIECNAKNAVGINEITSYINNKISISEAIDIASTRTRQYAKRQITWFCNQILDKTVIGFQGEKEYNDVKNNIIQYILNVKNLKNDY